MTEEYDVGCFKAYAFSYYKQSFRKGYVRGDVFPIIQKIDIFTANATRPLNVTNI